MSFRWKAHPVELRSTVVANDRLHLWGFTADGTAVHAERTFTLRETPEGHTVVTSHETQVGVMPWLGRLILGPRLHGTNRVFFEDLSRAATQ